MVAAKRRPTVSGSRKGPHSLMPDAPASCRPPPCSRSYSVNSFEGAIQCGLIRKSTLNGDLGKRRAGVRHKISGPTHTPFNQPSVRRLAKGLFERTSKMAYREVAHCCNLLGFNIAVEMGLEEFRCSWHLQ